MENKKNAEYKLGLALSGGGAKGFAHLGVFQALEDRNLKPDVISGTSAGAFAGVLYADGHNPREIVEMFKNRAFKEFAEFTIPQAGLFKSERFHTFLKKNLRSKTFDQLQIPLKVIATDIEEGTSVIFSEGAIIPTIIASCSVPIIFKPKEIDGKYYVDGGIFKNFPVSVIRNTCEKVIGINVAPLTRQKYKSSMLYVAERSFHYMSSSNTLYDKRLCDILVESTDLSKYTMFDLDHIEEIFQIGYDITIQALDEEAKRLETVNESLIQTK